MEEFEKMAAIELDEAEPVSPENPDLGSGSTDGGDTAEKPEASAEPETQPTTTPTAVMAANDEAPEASEPHTTETAAVEPAHILPSPQPPAGSPAIDAESTSAEAAPAAPRLPEQAETEIYPHDHDQ